MKVTADTQRQQGFTLVEILVVMFMFSAAIITLSGLFSYIQYAQRDVQYLDIATRAARAQVEYLRNGKYSTLSTGTPVNFTPSLPDTLPNGSTGVVTVSNAPGISGVKKLDVKVEWPVNGNGATRKSTTLTALIGASGLTQ
ncbi:prepilin-type N-terminal cleavage/methylation domain-containing protein [bacterium]|nr:MAG: prepilin-type N-terminal cleavage/methylation domain-containing protein [bacterium]